MTTSQTSAGNSNPKKPTEVPVSEYITLRAVRSDIHINDDDNPRQTLRGVDTRAAWEMFRTGKSRKDIVEAHGEAAARHAELTESIRLTGMEQPPLVRPATPADKTGGKAWVLYAGFRRMRAADNLGWDSLDVRRPAGPRDAKALHLAQLAENAARDNLSPYETAAGCDRIISEHKASENEVAAATGISRSHVNNLVRCLRKLPKDALEAWATPSHPAHKLATMDRLMKVAAAEDDTARQALWDEYVKGVPAVAPGATPGSGGTIPSGDGTKKMKARVVTERVKAVLSFINSKEGKEYAPPTDATWFGAFVRYLAGFRDKAPEGLGLKEKALKAKGKRGKKRTEGGKRARGEKAAG